MSKPSPARPCASAKATDRTKLRGQGQPDEPSSRHSAPSAEFSTREKITLAGILLLIYATVATWGHFDFSNMMGFYDLLADGFDQGNLYLEVTPEQGFIWDLIPYEGRYYLQWGPFPALLHLVGKWMGTGLSDRTAGMMAGWLSALIFFAIVLRLRRNYFPDVPKSVCAWFLFAFALATPLAFVALRGTIYHESIAIAGLGVVSAIFAFLRYVENASVKWTFCCGIGIAAALATRSSLGVYASALGAAVLVLQIQRKHALPKAVGHLLAYGAPVVISGTLLLMYNQARFGSPWDFGIQYLPSSVTKGFKIFDVQRVPENLKHYLLAPIRFETDYPWLIHEGWGALETTVRAEDMSSLLITSPFLVLGLFIWPLFRPLHQGQWPVALRFYVLTLTVSSLLVFGVMLTFGASSRRYSHDFVPLWMILVFVGVALQSRTPIHWRRWLAVGWTVVFFSGLVHAHLCFTRPEPADINVVRTLAALSPYARKVLPEGPNWDREEAIACNDVGTVYIKERRFREALAKFERANELMPNEPRIERNVQLARRLAAGGS